MYLNSVARRSQPLLTCTIAAIAVAACSATARFDVNTEPPRGKLPQERFSWHSDRGDEPATANLGWSATSKDRSSFEHEVVIVRHGDTLHGIANRSGVTVPMLLAANGLLSDRITPGLQLVVPRPTGHGG